MRSHSVVLLAALAATLAACPTPMNADAGDAGPMPADVPRTDATDARDVNTVPPTLFARCTSPQDCDPTGAGVGSIFCDREYGGGLCRIGNCRADLECGGNGRCAGARGCVPRCEAGASNDPCRGFSGVCQRFETMPSPRYGCFPSCYEAPPAGVPACVASTTCDPYSGRCAAVVSMVGADNGAACNDDAACRSGRCAPEVDDFGVATGFVGGACVSVGRQLSDMEWRMRAGQGLARSSCPAGSVVVPTVGQAAGDPTLCFRECRMDADCRAGYFCDRVAGAGGTPTFTTGACRPIDCAQAGRTCPPGYACEIAGADSGMPSGTCAPPRPADAGADAAADATRDGSADAGDDGGSEAGTDAGIDAGAG